MTTTTAAAATTRWWWWWWWEWKKRRKKRGEGWRRGWGWKSVTRFRIGWHHSKVAFQIPSSYRLRGSFTRLVALFSRHPTKHNRGKGDFTQNAKTSAGGHIGPTAIRHPCGRRPVAEGSSRVSISHPPRCYSPLAPTTHLGLFPFTSLSSSSGIDQNIIWVAEFWVVSVRVFSCGVFFFIKKSFFHPLFKNKIWSSWFLSSTSAFSSNIIDTIKVRNVPYSILIARANRYSNFTLSHRSGIL